MVRAGKCRAQKHHQREAAVASDGGQTVKPGTPVPLSGSKRKIAVGRCRLIAERKACLVHRADTNRTAGKVGSADGDDCRLAGLIGLAVGGYRHICRTAACVVVNGGMTKMREVVLTVKNGDVDSTSDGAVFIKGVAIGVLLARRDVRASVVHRVTGVKYLRVIKGGRFSVKGEGKGDILTDQRHVFVGGQLVIRLGVIVIRVIVAR